LAVGFLAQAIQIIENNQFSPEILRDSPVITPLRATILRRDDVPDSLRLALESEIVLVEETIQEAIAYMTRIPELKSLIQTTTAVTVVHGGEKGKQSGPSYESCERLTCP
jgi:hypothetical protein